MRRYGRFRSFAEQDALYVIPFKSFELVQFYFLYYTLPEITKIGRKADESFRKHGTQRGF